MALGSAPDVVLVLVDTEATIFSLWSRPISETFSMLLEVESDGSESSRISRVSLGGKGTSEGIGVTPSGKGYEERRCFPRSTDHDKKVPSILKIY
jgi:hypothetical protein